MVAVAMDGGGGPVSGNSLVQEQLAKAGGAGAPLLPGQGGPQPENQRSPEAQQYEGTFGPLPTASQLQGWPRPRASSKWVIDKFLTRPAYSPHSPEAVPRLSPEEEAEGLRETQASDRERLKEILRVTLGREPTPEELLAAWEEGLDAMDAAAAMGEDPKDPFHWLQGQADQAKEERSAKGLDPETGAPTPVEPRTVTETNIRTALTDPATARTLFDRMAYNTIGRELSDEEKNSFASMLRSEEEANPVTTVTETDIGPADHDPTVEQRGETRTTETGQAIDPTAFAEETIDSEFEEEAANYWDDQTGTQVLMQLISGF